MIWYKLSFELLGEPAQLAQIYVEPQHKIICNPQYVQSVEAQFTWELKTNDSITQKPNTPTKNKEKEADKVWEIENQQKKTGGNFKEESEEETQESLFYTPKNKKSKLKSPRNSPNENQEDQQMNKGFLEKLWGATAKNIQHFFTPIPTKKDKNNPINSQINNQKTNQISRQTKITQEKNQQAQKQGEEEIIAQQTQNPAQQNQNNTQNIIQQQETENHLFEDISPENTENLFSETNIEHEKKQEQENEKKQEQEKEVKKFVFPEQYTHFYNPDTYIRTIVCGAEHQGQILCIDLAEMPQNMILCRFEAFVLGRFGTQIQYFWKNETKKMAYLEIKGDDYIFLASNAFLKEYNLEDDAIIIPTHKLLAFQSVLVFEEVIQNLFFNPLQNTEIPLTKLTGRGKYWLG